MKGLKILVGSALAAASVLSSAQFYARGDIAGTWDAVPAGQLTQIGASTTYTKTFTGLNPNSQLWWKVGSADWSTDTIGAGRSMKLTPRSSSITVFYYDVATPNDGWEVNRNRVGYEGVGFNFELIGSMNGWNGQSGVALPDSVWKFTANLDAGTTYGYKYREAGDWSTEIGLDFAGDGFGNLPNNGDIQFTAAVTSPHEFTLDLKNGRYKVEAVPEPMTVAALGLGVAALARRKRK